MDTWVFSTDKNQLNEAFLTQWLDLLVLYPQFGKKANPARIEFVKKHLMSQAR